MRIDLRLTTDEAALVQDALSAWAGELRASAYNLTRFERPDEAALRASEADRLEALAFDLGRRLD